jgi:hypothetical protein
MAGWTGLEPKATQIKSCRYLTAHTLNRKRLLALIDIE